jgi:hypothetical protein
MRVYADTQRLLFFKVIAKILEVGMVHLSGLDRSIGWAP